MDIKKDIKNMRINISYKRVIGESKEAIEEFIYLVKKSNDLELLANYLEDPERPITPELRKFITSELRRLPSNRKKKPVFQCYPREVYQTFLNNMISWIATAETNPDIWSCSKRIFPKEIQENPRNLTKGERTELAKKLTASNFKLTPSQLDEILTPRKSREKSY